MMTLTTLTNKYEHAVAQGGTEQRASNGSRMQDIAQDASDAIVKLVRSHRDSYKQAPIHPISHLVDIDPPWSGGSPTFYAQTAPILT